MCIRDRCRLTQVLPTRRKNGLRFWLWLPTAWSSLLHSLPQADWISKWCSDVNSRRSSRGKRISRFWPRNDYPRHLQKLRKTKTKKTQTRFGLSSKRWILDPFFRQHLVKHRNGRVVTSQVLGWIGDLLQNCGDHHLIFLEVTTFWLILANEIFTSHFKEHKTRNNK